MSIESAGLDASQTNGMLDKLWEVSATANNESYQTSLDNTQMAVDTENNMTQLDIYYNQSSISQA